ncbi:hypothetical protein [Anaeroselena agilis]|uniref:Tetratricopeptide repeat protein n=1 Tax=Anaeroselena agilis TaxID=3063788 RepID=A0ABU3NUB7_9FIRM|nr:hypothetical protein [Selenomonadales bacterium 4137-cl]
MAASIQIINVLACQDKDGIIQYLTAAGQVQDNAAAQNQWFDDMNRVRQTLPVVLSLDELLAICEAVLTAYPKANNALFQRAVVLNDKGEYQDALAIINQIYPLMAGGKKPALFLKVQLLKCLGAPASEINDVLTELEGL